MGDRAQVMIITPSGVTPILASDIKTASRVCNSLAEALQSKKESFTVNLDDDKLACFILLENVSGVFIQVFRQDGFNAVSSRKAQLEIELLEQQIKSFKRQSSGDEWKY